MNPTFPLGGELEIRRLAFGAMRIVDDEAEGIRVLRRAVELGVNVIGTADVYGAGRSEETIAEALHAGGGLTAGLGTRSPAPAFPAARGRGVAERPRAPRRGRHARARRAPSPRSDGYRARHRLRTRSPAPELWPGAGPGKPKADRRELELRRGRGFLRAPFDFDSLAEVSVPERRRRWGYDVLPTRFRDRLSGRVEPAGAARIERAQHPGTETRLLPSRDGSP